MKELAEFEDSFRDALSGKYSSPEFAALHKTIRECSLSTDYFFDLLSAFTQDITKKSYKSYDEVLDYCRRSANPVGRLMLELFNVSDEKAFNYSDRICTALQLTNFLQDVTEDHKKGRIYIPESELKEYSVSESDFKNSMFTANFREVVKFNLERIRIMFYEGRELIPYLSGLFKLEILWTIGGGEKILNKIEKNNFNVLNKRPKVNKLDFIFIFFNPFIYVRSKKHIQGK